MDSFRMRGTPAGTLFESEGALWMPWGSAIVSWTHQTVRRVPLASDRHYPPSPMCPPGLSHGVSLRAFRGFPAGSPQAHTGFSPGILPRRRTRQAHGIRPDKTSAFPGVRPRRSDHLVQPGLLKAFSQGPSREAHGKGMGGWG